MSVIFPKPTSGASPESSWLNQFLDASNRSRVLSVEGYDLQETTNGINFKKKFLPPPPSTGSPAQMFPFKLYQIGNQSATDAQKVLFAGQDINRFTFQIRSGVVGLRSQYVFGPTEDGSVFGAYESETFCECTDDTVDFGSQPVANAARSVQLLNAADVLIYDASVSMETPCQILLDPTVDALGYIQAAFWLKIIDDDGPLQMRTQLWGRMFTGNPLDPTGRPTNCLPSFTDQSIIPLARADLRGDGIPIPLFQYQWGNLVNRYASLGPISSPLGPVNIQRGYWTADGLSGQLFYKGDVVVNETVKVLDFTPDAALAGALYGVYTYQGTVGIESAIPTSNATWRLTGLIYLD